MLLGAFKFETVNILIIFSGAELKYTSCIKHNIHLAITFGKANTPSLLKISFV